MMGTANTERAGPGSRMMDAMLPRDQMLDTGELRAAL